MKAFTQYINEALTNKQGELLSDMFMTMFKDTKLSKDTIKILLGNLDKEIIGFISKSYNKNDASNYLAYEPNEDLFIKYEDNKDKILDQISEYISKYRL
jgi:hypothetical protein